MNPRAIIAGAALGALVAVVSIIATKGDEKPLDVAEKCFEGAHLALNLDGGRAYWCPVQVGTARSPDCTATRPPEECPDLPVLEARLLTQSTHVRAPKGQTDGGCLIREPRPDGGFGAPRFFGELNRMPRAWSVGPGCEEVAGLVDNAKDSDRPEADVLTEKRTELEGAAK